MNRPPTAQEVDQIQQDRERMRRTTFVHPVEPGRGDVVRREPMQLQPMPQPTAGALDRRDVRQKEIISGTSLDRAHAFRVRTGSIAGMTAVTVAAIWFLTRWALPTVTGGATAGVLLVGVFAILAALGAFLAVWIVAYLADMLLSPGGVDLYESWRTQRRIDAQSDAMVEAYRRAHGLESDR